MASRLDRSDASASDCPIRDENAVRFDGDVIVTAQFLGDCVSQFRQAFQRSGAIGVPVPDRVLSRSDDMGRSVQIRIALTQTDDIGETGGEVHQQIAQARPISGCVAQFF